MPDFVFSNHGSLFMVRPVTDDAKEWVEDNVSLEPWQWLGDAFSVAHRYAADLAEGIQSDGLTIS